MEARANPDTFVIAIDAVAAAMDETSRRAAAKPERGGAPNAMFICAAAETLPGPLTGLATRIAVNYPWGSLLRTLAQPDPGMLARIVRTGAAGAAFTSFINVQPLRDPEQAAKLGLKDAALLHDAAEMETAYARAGLTGLRLADVSDAPQPATSWGRKLAASRREILQLEARVSPAPRTVRGVHSS